MTGVANSLRRMNTLNSPSLFSLLIVDDDPKILSSLKRIFYQEDYQVHTAPSGEEALEALKNFPINAVLTDLKMPGMDGLSLLKEIREDYPCTMVILLTGQGGVQEAVTAIKMGAADFLEKPFSQEGLRARVAQLHQIWKLKQENERLKESLRSRFEYDRLVGNSTALLRLKDTIAQVGPTDVSVLIQGETGTGKELVAHAIHHHSHRILHPFVPVDCASISESIMESELFGHVKGAFTGAHTSVPGLIRSAHEGTLFLDEIGELPLLFQTKLLRVIQEREVRPVGSSKSYPVDIRIIAATNRNLEEEVKEGHFREDLFYRLNVVTLTIPSLMERKTDTALLARHFLKRFSNELSPVEDISREALLCLENYNWPGNVRELENVIRRAVALGRNKLILPEDLPSHICPPGPPTIVQSPPSGDTLAAYEKAAIENALQKSEGNRKKAAHILDIGEATLYRKIKQFHIGD